MYNYGKATYHFTLSSKRSEHHIHSVSVQVSPRIQFPSISCKFQVQYKESIKWFCFVLLQKKKQKKSSSENQEYEEGPIKCIWPLEAKRKDKYMHLSTNCQGIFISSKGTGLLFPLTVPPYHPDAWLTTSHGAIRWGHGFPLPIICSSAEPAKETCGLVGGSDEVRNCILRSCLLMRFMVLKLLKFFRKKNSGSWEKKGSHVLHRKEVTVPRYSNSVSSSKTILTVSS